MRHRWAFAVVSLLALVAVHAAPANAANAAAAAPAVGTVLLPAALTGLPVDSVVNVTQLVTRHRVDLDDRIGAVPTWLMNEVDRGLRRVLAL